MTGGGSWSAAYQKARALVAQMTLEEKVCMFELASPRDDKVNVNSLLRLYTKVNMTGGVDLGTGCSGSIYPVE